MHEKFPCVPIGAIVSVFGDFCWKLLNLMGAETFKKIENFF